MSLSLGEPIAYTRERRRLLVRTRRWLRRLFGWSMLGGWVILPLLPGFGFLLSAIAGLRLF